METQTHTGTGAFVRTTVRLPAPLHRALRITALDACTSVSALIAGALDTALADGIPPASVTVDGGIGVSVSLPAALHRSLRIATIDAGAPAGAIVTAAVAALLDTTP